MHYLNRSHEIWPKIHIKSQKLPNHIHNIQFMARNIILAFTSYLVTKDEACTLGQGDDHYPSTNHHNLGLRRSEMLPRSPLDHRKRPELADSRSLHLIPWPHDETTVRAQDGRRTQKPNLYSTHLHRCSKH